ncbi:hypothetical protein ACFVAV_27430 [Nocardia sp. NPDC057663]|uniref:hypothetical protein n=1 Tax=Nocardia sp. NPDC057663 TaxID=3346201 RepID=UPI0036700F76
MRFGSGYSTDISVEYFAQHPSSVTDSMVPAFFSIDLVLPDADSRAGLILSIEDARTVAEELTRLLMSHDAIEHAAKEHAAAVAESQAA